jgi:hypothetical protein
LKRRKVNNRLVSEDTARRILKGGWNQDISDRFGEVGEGLHGLLYAEMFYRRNFCKREKRGDSAGKTKRGKGSKIMPMGDAAGLPVAIFAASVPSQASAPG